MPVQTAVQNYLQSQNGKAFLSAEVVAKFCQQFRLNRIDFALACLPVAASYSLAPISQFYVGAIAIGVSGNFYLGANQEFVGVPLSNTIHAEQSAIMHAWQAGEKGISDVVVNYTPCGHCRQFMNELSCAEHLKIHLPHSQNNLLHSYLPDAFGPRDLNVTHPMFDSIAQELNLVGDELTKAALRAAGRSYAPYSQLLSGVALQTGEQIICGSYVENAAFNPTFPPLQNALNFYRLQGNLPPISRVVLAENQAPVSHKDASKTLAQAMLGLTVEFMAI